MSQDQSSAQEKNIKKMNELLDEKNAEASEQQDSNSQAQKNQSLKDNARMPDENNKLTNSDNNRNP